MNKYYLYELCSISEDTDTKCQPSLHSKMLVLVPYLVSKIEWSGKGDYFILVAYQFLGMLLIHGYVLFSVCRTQYVNIVESHLLKIYAIFQIRSYFFIGLRVN